MIAVGAFIVGALIFILSKIFGGSEGIPSGTPPVVIVTVLDPGHYNAAYITNVKDNRMEYARRHGKDSLSNRVGIAVSDICRIHNILSYRDRL